MSDKQPKKVQAELAQRAKGQGTGKELVFDPQTGELLVKAPSESLPSPDSAVVDSIAEDGFFARETA